MILDIPTLATVARNLDAEAAVYMRRATSYAKQLSRYTEGTEEWWTIFVELQKNLSAGQALHEASEGCQIVVDECETPGAGAS